MTILKIAIYSLATILGFFSPPLSAEGGAYQIELMVFSQTMPTTEVFEQAARPTQWPPDLTELSAYKKPDSTTLDDSYAVLSKDSSYLPILYIAWIQSVGDGGLSAPVHIQNTDGKLNGYVQIQQGQNLQMAVNFELTSNSEKTVAYRLNETRLIKPHEVYYLDHPKFGVIAKINPL